MPHNRVRVSPSPSQPPPRKASKPPLTGQRPGWPAPRQAARTSLADAAFECQQQGNQHDIYCSDKPEREAVVRQVQRFERESRRSSPGQAAGRCASMPCRATQMPMKEQGTQGKARLKRKPDTDRDPCRKAFADQRESGTPAQAHQREKDLCSCSFIHDTPFSSYSTEHFTIPLLAPQHRTTPLTLYRIIVTEC